MTKPSPSPWGTLQDLLLAFAVHRHGTTSWDSVASELRKRTPDLSLSLTPQNCRLKYLDLKRRFAVPDGYLDGHDARHDKSDAEVSAPLLEELRKLRVAELRREVQRYDLNIESLELKVKNMEEERERSLREESESDLEKKSQGNICVEPESEPATAGEPVTGEDLEKDQLSVNESNSTDLGAERLKTHEKEPEPPRTGEDDARHDRTGQVSGNPAKLNSEPDRKLVPEDSFNGSSNSIEKPDRKAKGEPEKDSNGLVEPDTVSDGGGGEEATKENSDVQSSASRSRKEERNAKVRRERKSGDEREHEDQSRVVKDLSAESQPLVDFLRSIRAQKIGSVFERRLRNQETPKYQKLVLQHMDLETIGTRLKEGWYSGSSSKFYRDLLLLVNNALVFFGKKSAEAKAAAEIRQLVSKEISQKQTKSNSSSRKQVSLQSLSMSKREESEPLNSLVLKPRISGSLIVCRKRSSITAKALGADKKKEQRSSLSEEKNTKQHSQQSGSVDEPKPTKKRARDRLSSIPANTKKNGKNQSNNGNKKAVPESAKQQAKRGSTPSQPAETKSSENKKNLDSKKRGAANFLNRMKQGSSSSNNNGVLLDALKSRPLTSESSSCKVKKNENTKHGEKKEAVVKRSVEPRQGKEKGSPGKRNVGRPPKRGASSPALGKRVREQVESETKMETPTPKQAKKRTRKL